MVFISLLLLNSIVFIKHSVYKTFYAYTLIAQGRIEERPGVLMGEALIGFLVSLFLLYFL